jgi:hypothetical protein
VIWTGGAGFWASDYLGWVWERQPRRGADACGVPTEASADFRYSPFPGTVLSLVRVCGESLEPFYETSQRSPPTKPPAGTSRNRRASNAGQNGQGKRRPFGSAGIRPGLTTSFKQVQPRLSHLVVSFNPPRALRPRSWFASSKRLCFAIGCLLR